MENEGIISITISIENTYILSDIHSLLGQSERVLRDGILRVRGGKGGFLDKLAWVQNIKVIIQWFRT